MNKLTPIKAIRAYCLECSGGQPSEVRNCLIVECPLYSYRFGKNPKRSGIGNLKASFSQKIQSQEAITDSLP